MGAGMRDQGCRVKTGLAMRVQALSLGTVCKHDLGTHLLATLGDYSDFCQVLPTSSKSARTGLEAMPAPSVTCGYPRWCKRPGLL